MSSSRLIRFASLAVAAALAVIGLKLGGWWITDSVGLLSDALESLANLAGAIVACFMLLLASRPPDDEHAYGHGKAEYFSSGFEGALILMAAGSIAVVAGRRLLDPHPLEEVGLGLILVAAATALNWGVGRVLLREGERHRSITLEASGRHLMTDVWTSVGVIAGVGAAELTGWSRLDPLIALAVAAHILATGVSLLRRSALGFLDTALPGESRSRIQRILGEYEARGIDFHALRTRRAGRQSFISLHVLVPGEWTVQRGHELAEEIEARLRDAVPGSTVFTHLEPLEDPVSFQDTRIHPPSE